MAKQQYIRTEYSDGAVVLSNIRNSRTDDIYSLRKVTTMPDGTALTDALVSKLSPIYRKLDDEYFARVDISKGVDIENYGTGLSGLVNLVSKTVFAQKVINISKPIDLEGGIYTIPDGLVFNFVGGSFKNGRINATNTLFTGHPLFISCIIGGTPLNNKCYMDWWGPVGQQGVDDSVAIANCFSSSAFSTGFKIIELSKKYWISAPVKLPYNAKIIGRSGKNNMKTGIIANTNFTKQVIDFPSRNGYPAFQHEVSGMFYHQDTTSLEMHDIFLDSSYKADFCIEAIGGGYGSCDLYYCYIKGALTAGVLGYGAEQPKIHYSTLYGNNCAYLVTNRKVNKADLLDFSGDGGGGSFYGIANIVEFIGNYVSYNNYGVIANVGSDIKLDLSVFGHNSICAGYLGASYVDLSKVYTEGDGVCRIFVDEGGVDQGVQGVTHPKILSANRDGFTLSNRSNSEFYYNEKTYYRAPFVFFRGTVFTGGMYWSYIPRGADVTGATTVENPINRGVSGVDALFIDNTQGSTGSVNISGVSEFPNGKNALLRTKFFGVVLPKTPDTLFNRFNITLNPDNKYNRLSKDLIHIGALANTPEDYSHIGSPIIQGDVNFRKLNTFQNSRVFNSAFGAFSDFNKSYYSENPFVENYQGWNLYQLNTLKIATFEPSFFKDINSIAVEVMIKMNQNSNTAIWVRLYKEDGTLLKHQSNNVSGSIPGFVAGSYRLMRIYANVDYFGPDTVKWIQIGLTTSGGTNLASSPRIHQIGDAQRVYDIKEDLFLSRGTTTQRPASPTPGFQFFDTTIGRPVWWNGTVWVDATGATV